MKLRSFLMGSLVGASAMWVYTKRKSTVMSIISHTAKDMLKKNKTAPVETKPGLEQHYSHVENESIIRSIIEQDDELSAQFKEITASSNNVTEQSQEHQNYQSQLQ